MFLINSRSAELPSSFVGVKWAGGMGGFREKGWFGLRKYLFLHYISFCGVGGESLLIEIFVGRECLFGRL